MSNTKLTITNRGDGVLNAITGIVPEFDPDVEAVQNLALEEKLTQRLRGKNPFESTPIVVVRLSY